jgi:hypothetical protein
VEAVSVVRVSVEGVECRSVERADESPIENVAEQPLNSDRPITPAITCFIRLL